jgi:hypothetical protein
MGSNGPKKLQLRRESIRELTRDDLRRVVGGRGNSGHSNCNGCHGNSRGNGCCQNPGC